MKSLDGGRSRLLCDLLVAAALLAAPGRIEALPYGVNAHVPSPELLDVVAASGAEWVRIDFIWAWVEPEPDRFHWEAYDAVVREARARHLKIYATLAYTPDWATAGATWIGVPDNPADWYDVCFRAASRYRGQIDHWGMWNEPNNDRFFQGGRRDYIDGILKTGSAAVRAANPAARVCGPELAHLDSAHWDGWLTDVLADASDALDVVTHHAYPDNGTAGSVIRLLSRDPDYPWEAPSVRTVLKRGGWANRPFWLTETGYNAASRTPASEQAQQTFVVNLLRAAPAEVPWLHRIFLYEMADGSDTAGAGWGLVGAGPGFRRKAAFEGWRGHIATAAVNDAEFVRATLPKRMQPGEAVSAEVTVRNAGTTTWSVTSGHALAAFGGDDPLTASRHALSAGLIVPPGAEVTFTLPLLAPDDESPPGRPYLSDWQMERSGVGFGDLHRTEVTVASDGAADVYYLLAVAHTDGLNGTRWRTDVSLHNPGVTEARVGVAALLEGHDNETPRRVERIIPGGRSERLVDVLGSLFGVSGVGALRLEVTAGEVRALSRTYTLVGDGSCGQSMPALDAAAAITPGGEVRLIGLTRAEGLESGYRCNLGVLNTAPVAGTVEVELRDAGGWPLGRRWLDLPPFGYLQITDIFGAVTDGAVEQGVAVLRAASAEGSFLGYATVVDNRSGDPVLLTPVVCSDEPQWIAAAAHSAGMFGSQWRTDVRLHNPGTTPTEVSVAFVGAAGVGSERAFVVEPDAALALDDVVADVVGRPDAGALRLRVRGGALSATSRTYNLTANGTFGQAVPAMPESRISASGNWVRLIGLASAPGATSGTRTNIGVVNLEPNAATVRIRLYDGTLGLSGYLGTFVVQLQGYEWRQLNDALRQLTDRAVPEAYATVHNEFGGGRILAYASVIDNGTGDAVYIPAQ
jgi:hypothetical protein